MKQQKQNILANSSGITSTRAPYMPKINAMISIVDGAVPFLIDSIITKKKLALAAIADTGPAGPLLRAF